MVTQLLPPIQIIVADLNKMLPKSVSIYNELATANLD